MCGFGGVVNYQGQLTPDVLRPVAASVAYRGPDSCGIRILDETLQSASTGRHAVFFNRLAIIDPDPRSDQPFEDERYLLTFNGEIYNYSEIKIELEAKGCRFKTTSDTEVLFQALATWGTGALEKINGMFAFFWLDRQLRKFVIARDRLGIKPLYYSQDGNSLQFASELSSLMQLRKKPWSIYPPASEMYLWMQFVPTPFSIFEDVFKLPPGHFIEQQLDDPSPVEPVCYWDAYSAKRSAISSRNLEEVLTASLQRQLHADVPLGLFLSSGVDSSLLAALVHKHFSSGDPVNFFTIQFEQSTAADESDDARRFIKGFNNPSLRFHPIAVNAASIRDRLENLYHYYDEPFGDHASLLNWAVSERARQHVTVAISGDGADEMFWGYGRYRRWQQFTRINRTPALPQVARLLQAMLPESSLRRNLRFVFDPDPVRRHFNLFLPSGSRRNLNRSITRHKLWALQEVDRIRAANELPGILDMKTYLSDAMLYKVDRSSMACALEVRVPYLDNQVIDYALTLPLSHKSTSRFPAKSPLKSLLTSLAPHYDVHRPKKGFSFPLNDWLKGGWKALVLETVDEQTLEETGVDGKQLNKLVREFYAGKNNYFTDVWYIFNLALWLKTFKRTSTPMHA